jgi:hypothetical protein
MSSALPIEIDFVNDWAEGVRQQLAANGYPVASTVSYEELCHRFLNLRQRSVSVVPRTVLISREMICPPELRSGLDLVREKIERGEDLRPHLSRTLTDLDFDDMLLNDWGLHHLHLGVAIEPDGFAKRTGPVLFARFTHDTAYFVAVLVHGSWTRQELVKIIHLNWEDSIRRYRLPGVVGVEPAVTDAELGECRQSGLTVFLEVEPGVVYAPLGGGYATSGVSTRVVTECDSIVERLQNYEDRVREIAPRFAAAAQARGLVLSDKLVFRLRREGDLVCAVEETTKGVISLSPSNA